MKSIRISKLAVRLCGISSAAAAGIARELPALLSSKLAGVTNDRRALQRAGSLAELNVPVVRVDASASPTGMAERIAVQAAAALRRQLNHSEDRR